MHEPKEEIREDPMPEPLSPGEVYPLVSDRIHDLYATSAELRAGRKPAPGRTGFVTRTRSTIGRRLISIGSAVAGQGA
jgi:hypothetical protein